jgi:Polyketide cyclase / dehydrase and lipid transport.
MHSSRLILVGAFMVAATGAASAASVDKSIGVKAPAEKVWGMIGAFCSIKDWHPAIGQCTEADGVRTLTTKDGKTQFVEKQTSRDDKAMSYSYAIQKSPLPITGYQSTIKVVPKGKDASTVEWSSTFTPAQGKEQDAIAAIAGIYQAGLDNIQKMGGM